MSTFIRIIVGTVAIWLLGGVLVCGAYFTGYDRGRKRTP